MMLTIHGLPISVKYQDLKSMIKEKCNISDYILDNLLTENDGTKKVRVGLADEREGSYLIKCLNGFRMGPNVLSVVPVGKPPPSNPPSNFDQRGYPPRNDYPSQQSGFGNRPIDPIGRTEPLREPNRLDPWGSGNQWSGNQSGPHGQPPPQQNNFGYQQPQGMNTGYGQQATPQSQRPEMRRFDQRDSFPSRQPPQDQGYGFQAKNNLPDSVATRRAEARPHALRSVEVVNEPLPRYSVPEYVAAIKPVTIMKDNFQGPQYNSDRQPNQPGQYHGPQGQPGPGQSHSGPGHPIGGPGQQATWNQQLQQKAPFAKSSPSAYDRKFPEPDKRAIMSKTMAEPMRNIHDQGFNKPGPRFSPRRDVPAAHGRMSSPGRRISSPGRRLLSPGRRLQSPGRRLQSPGRRLLSPGRRLLSPGRRLLSPGRRLQSPGRRLQSPGRRLPSPGHRMPSPGRRMVSPGRRMPSPGRRMQSPGRRMPSPGKRNSPGRRSPGRLPPRRYSPSDKYSQRPAAKDVRPAYDPPSQAFNAGGYRPSLHENVQYPIPGYRQPEQKATPWQTDRDKAMFHGGMKKDDDRREGVRMPKFEGREDPKRSPRKSRSPRRDRSPQRDRFKKHSPSPRSPRRSWALEKRRSPDIRDAPPPPLWPGQNQESFRSRFDEDDKPKRTPVWESRRPEDERRFDEVRGRPQQEPSPRPYKGDDRFPPREPKFEPRDPKFESREPKFEPRDLKFEPRQPRFEPRDPKFEPRQPKFEPRDSKFEPRDPKFEPREPKFEPREPKFEPRDPKFEPRAPKFESRDPKFEPRGPIFEPREEFPKRFSSDFKETPRPNEDIRQGPRHERREDFPRGEFRREEERNIPKIPEAFNKEFEDVYKRALELNKRAEELRRREDRRRDDYEDRREDHDSKNYDKKFDSREAPRDRHDELKRREPEWKTEDRHWGSIPASLKAKKEKALEEIVDKIMDKYGSHFTGEMKARVMEELRLPVGKILVDLFGYQDVSFIEMVVKFQAKINGKEELKLFDDVIASLPTHFRTKKRAANDTARVEVPAKTARRSPDPNMNRDVATTGSIQHVPEWTPNFQPNIVMANQMMMGQFGLMQHVPLMEQQPLMVPAPGFMEMAQQQNQQQDIQQNTFQGAKPHFEPREDEGYNLYLCKDDFEPYNDNQAEYLKKFLVSQLINASGQQWSPDFTIKGLQSLFRYEVIARDEATRDWLLNISFSEFALFNVLVYTKEELWYERAAVWLPGHSRCRNIEPLTKLKLQNRKLDGVNVGKWKLVKKIMTAKGTRIYVDMPPSSARALEKQKMMLSYELQKVSVFLKAVAVDKEAFDSGLRELSVRDPTVILAAAQASPMPSLGHEAGVVKICLKGSKALSVVQARKIKEMLIYHIFKYHQDYEHGALRTDFIKFGFCLPGYFGVVPENPESKRWLLDLDIGKLNRHAVVVMGSDDSSTKYIKMSVMLRREPSLNAALIFERLKQSNQGVKGLNFNLWKPNKVNPSRDRSKSTFCVDMDLESVDTLMKMNFKLDYIDDRGSRLQSVYARCEEDSKVEDLVKKLKAELSDSYDVANMDIASSEEEDDDIIFMGEERRVQGPLKYPYKAARFDVNIPAKMQRIKELYPSKTVAKTVPAAKVAKPVHKPTINVKTVQKINKPESGVPKDTITKEKITPVAEAKPEKLYELSPLLSKALEEELQQIMVKVWEDHDEPCSDTEKLVAERFKAETEDDLKNVLGLNATKRLLNVYNPLFVMVEFNRKPDGDGLRSFVRWMNCVALKRVNDGSEHKYCAQLKKMADYERVSSKSVIKFSNLTVKLTPTYKFTECPTNLKTIYKMNKLKRKPNLNIQDVSKDSTTANTAKIEENSEAKRVKTEKNTDKKVEPLKTVAKSQTVKQPAGAPQKQEAKPPVKKTGSITNPTVNNKAPTKTEVTKPTPPKQLDQPPKVVEKSKPNLVNKATAVTKPVAKSVNTTTAASKTVNTATAATKPVDKAAAVTKPVNTTTAATKSVNTATAATKPVDKATAVTKPVNTTTAATKPVNTATAATKPVNTATAVTKPVKTANTVTKPISKPVNTAPAVTKPIAKPVNKTTAATKPIAKPVNKTTAVTNVREKKKERKPGDFDELDDEDILALMSNAIVLDECSGSDDEV